MALEALPAFEVRQRPERAGRIVFVLVLGLTAVTVLGLIALRLPAALLFILPLPFVTAWLLRYPRAGMYALFGATLLIPVDPLRFPDAITDNIPFFVNLSDPHSLNLSGLGVTPAEILMLIIFIGLIGTMVANRQTLPTGRLMTPYVIFGLAVLLGEIVGLFKGGNFKLSLWELRPQVYGLAVFVMATQLLAQRSQIKVLVAILAIAETFKGGVGVVRYFITLNRELDTLEAIQAHEESYLLGLFLVAVVIGLIWFRRPLMVLLVAATPFVFTAIVVNHRRAGIGALGLEVVIVLILAYTLEPRLRRPLLVVASGMTLVCAAVVIVFWNQQYGAIAEMIRPIRSAVDPTARDLSSDLYRLAESNNLRATFRTSPLLGVGFGHPYNVIYPQNGVAKIDPLWNVIPHNSLLWVPMRMGVVGVITFWGLISMAIIEAIWVMRNVPDTLIRAVAVFALATIAGELFIAYVDIGLENYRTLIVLGLVLALISRAPYLAHRHEDKRGLNGSEEPIAKDEETAVGLKVPALEP